MSTPLGAVPAPGEAHLGRGYGAGATDFASNNPTMSSPLSQSAGAHGYEDYDASQRGGSSYGGGLNRSASVASTAVGGAGGVSRNNTLKKRSSVRRTGSLRRSGSRKSLKAGSIKGFGGGADDLDFNSAFYTPVPTTGTPTDALADRFQAWRQLLKSLIAYFREIQNSYETRAKALHKVQNTIANIPHPAGFMDEDGLGEATRILNDYHRRSIAEANKSRDIENDVIGALTGLRSDLGQKIKEIKSLSGDFKNSVEKEKEATRREVEKLQDALEHSSLEAASGKDDPYVVRLGVDRAVEKQIDEENYLHRAYLNLESSGRELESIVVGEIQKAYNALAGILKREGDDAYSAVEQLRTGPVSMPKDREWYQFVTSDEHFVDPSIPIRRIDDITYPGKHHPAAAEIRAGMLERKSKYLKSYTPGWYVLSPTHLHEFKSADKIYSQPPVMSLQLGDQKLGSHSEPGSSSHKFMLKGKQAGSMHKGHNWVFRAETHDTMLAWFEDIKTLTEKSGEERNAFVRKHARSVSATSDRATVSSDGLEEDEADQTPYSADVASLAEPTQPVRRPQPGGRFPSDLAIRTIGSAYPTDNYDLADDGAVIAAAGALPGSEQHGYGDRDPYRLEGVLSSTPVTRESKHHDAEPGPHAAATAGPFEPAPTTTANPTNTSAAATAPTTQTQTTIPAATQSSQPQPQSFLGAEPAAPVASDPTPLATSTPLTRTEPSLAPVAAAALGGAGVGAGAVAASHSNNDTSKNALETPEPKSIPADFTNTATAETPSGDPIIAPAGITKNADSASTTVAAETAASTTAEPTPVAAGLGGNEGVGARETGSFFPAVVRHNTDISVS